MSTIIHYDVCNRAKKTKKAHVTRDGFILWFKGRILENPVVCGR